MNTIKIAEEYKHKGVVGVDFCGNPFQNDFADFKQVFEYARTTAQLPITLHCAEILHDSETQTILNFKPNRIGHGAAMSDQLTAQLVKQMQPVEICITSNVMTKTTSTHAVHPFPLYFNSGVPVSVSCDDRGVFNITLTHEYELLQREFNFTNDQMEAIARSAVQMCFCSQERKAELYATMEAFSNAEKKTH